MTNSGVSAGVDLRISPAFSRQWIQQGGTAVAHRSLPLRSADWQEPEAAGRIASQGEETAQELWPVQTAQGELEFRVPVRTLPNAGGPQQGTEAIDSGIISRRRILPCLRSGLPALGVNENGITRPNNMVAAESLVRFQAVPFVSCFL